MPEARSTHAARRTSIVVSGKAQRKEEGEGPTCTKYDKNGFCDKSSLTCPTLAGENISSVIINGDYVVLFVYKGPQDNGKGPWTSCAIYPYTNDTNKIGPQQIKWENIRNRGSVIPNYMVIIPVQQK